MGTVFGGVPRPFTNPSLSNVHGDAEIDLVVQSDSGARFRLDTLGVREVSSEELRSRIGIGR